MTSFSALALAFPVAAVVVVGVPCAQEIPADKEPQKAESGIVYSVLANGEEGGAPKVGDAVEVRHHMWLSEGTLLDSSWEAPMPRRWVVGQSPVPGLDEVLPRMTPGAHWKVTIPAELAFGERGSPPVIPPNADLVYEIEVQKVTPARWTPPPFQAPDREKQKKTDSGLAYEVLAAGSGETPKPDQYVQLEVAIWNRGGRLVMSTAQDEVKGPAGQFAYKALAEAVPLMRPGARWRLEVPPELAFGETDNSPLLPPNSTTIWDVQLVRVIEPLPLPEFELPPDEKLTKTESGLKYQVLEEGEGTSPQPTDTVKVHYAGWLTDGTLFDSSLSKGEPAEFGVGGVIDGWKEGLQLMKPGAIYRFVIPPDLAYGHRRMGPIPSNATLVFWVQLLE